MTGLINLLSKSLLQDHNLKASVLQHSAFMVQLSHLYMTGKTITLTIQTFISKVMCLLFNMMSRFVIAFIPRSKGLSISWMQSPFTVILEPKKIKPVTVSTLVIFNHYLQQVIFYNSGHKFLKIKLIRTFENIYPPLLLAK